MSQTNTQCCVKATPNSVRIDALLTDPPPILVCVLSPLHTRYIAPHQTAVLDIKKRLSVRSERVKSVELHPQSPWVLAALYSGKVFIWDYETSTVLKSFEVSTLPVRCAKFIVRKQWFVCASDDMKIRVYNYNTMEKVKEFEAHNDYIRTVEVHPTLPYLLSSSDDMSVKLWDWDKNFANTITYEGHAHYVMMVKINPKDTNVFATASLDRTIKVWGLTSPSPHYSLEGHERGVNCIDYYPSGDKPYLLSGSDDKTVKVWDYQTKSCVATLQGHGHNVCDVSFHPRLPLLASASEDGTLRIWHAGTYAPAATLNYGLERAWCCAPSPAGNKWAIGYDEGCVVLEVGSDEAVVSMDQSGKVVYAKNRDVLVASVKGLASGEKQEDGTSSSAVEDGAKLPLVGRSMGTAEVFPTQLSHNCNGRFISVCGDGEFIIYTAQALRNKAFGSALDFVWSARETGDYAIRETISRVKIFNNFKESKVVKPATASAEALYGGHLLGVKGSDEAVLFYDWVSGEFVRKIDVSPKEVYWSDAGDLVCLACDEVSYVLSHNAAVTASALALGKVTAEEGVDGSFDFLYEIQDKVTSGMWVGDCFLYTNAGGRLNYSVSGQIQTLVHLESGGGSANAYKILGYLAKEDRVFLVDKNINVISYKVMLAMLQYQTAVVRGNFDKANELLPLIPETEYLTVARFLEAQGFKEEALAVTTDPDHKFDLAMELGQLSVALELVRAIKGDELETTDTMNKWKKLSDLALSKSDFALAEEAARASNDYTGLLLLYTALGNAAGMQALAGVARKAGKANVAFVSYLLIGDVESCVNLLVETDRIPEAAFFARTYAPSMVSGVVKLWKGDLSKVSERAAAALAEPASHPGMFKDFDVALEVEKMLREQRTAGFLPASDYLTAKDTMSADLIALAKSGGLSASSSTPISPAAVSPTKAAQQAPLPPPQQASPVKEAVVPPPAPSSGGDGGDSGGGGGGDGGGGGGSPSANADAGSEKRALEAAHKAEAEALLRAAEESKARAEADLAQQRILLAAARAKQAEEVARAKAEAEEKAREEEEAKRKAEKEAAEKEAAEREAAEKEAAEKEAAEKARLEQEEAERKAKEEQEVSALADEFAGDW